jgi:hypothetical protein
VCVLARGMVRAGVEHTHSRQRVSPARPPAIRKETPSKMPQIESLLITEQKARFPPRELHGNRNRFGEKSTSSFLSSKM